MSPTSEESSLAPVSPSSSRASASSSATASWVIATDLDGTLLDRSYDLKAATSALNRVLTDYPWVTEIVLATSKTLSELLPMAALCNAPPVLLSENGAGYALASGSEPQTYRDEVVGASYLSIRSVLDTLRDERKFEFAGFADMTIPELCNLTGLTAEDAALAKKRSASEPLLWYDTEERLKEFQDLLGAQGLQLVRGGQFYHVNSALTDKARALDAWHKNLAKPVKILACGDAPNDRQMLALADRAIVFPGGEHGALLPESPTTTHAPAAGPDGWFDAVTAVLTHLEELNQPSEEPKP